MQMKIVEENVNG